MNRRSFLRRSAATVPAIFASQSASAVDSAATSAGAPQTGARATPARSGSGSSFDPWVEIEPRHLTQNVAEVSRAVGGRPIMAVIKNNGYGLGVVPIAQALAPLPQIRGLAVVKLQEAIAVRDAGVKSPLLLMGPFDERDLAEMQAKDIMPMVYTPVGETLARVAARSGRRLKLHVCVDTGLGREGVPYRESEALVRDLAGRKELQIEGLMTTFSEDRAFDREQLARFDGLASSLGGAGIAFGVRHAASSYTFFQHDDVWFDMVRPGMALFGVYPDPKFRGLNRMTLRPAGALRTRVVFVKKLVAGESAGYERAYIAKDDVWVATLPVGHADGWPRAAAKGARVRIGTAQYPVIASVSASHTILEIGREPAVRVGDVATLWDWEEGSRPEDVATACGASVYDLLMHLGGHLRRQTV